MKVSLNSIRGLNKRYHCADDVAAIGIDQLIEKIGSQLGAIEEIAYVGDKYKGIVIAKVVECTKLENSDHLSVCKIDDGGVVKAVERDEKGLVQVVCGAPNVRAGQLVAWMPPGTTVPETVNKEPFVLEAREFRGVVSNGMVASLKELALGDSHEGILEITGEYQPGTDFATAFDLTNDVIIDIENKMFTHRPDCFGFLGVSRELAGIQNMPFKSPDWYNLKPTFPDTKATLLPLQVTNDLPELVPRFSAITLSNIQVGPSPSWLQVELGKLGQKSINNIVDYTNFFMLETGQPLHAYDYDKVVSLSGDTGATIVIRNPRAEEKIKLLNGKEIMPRREAIMIATDKQLIGIGGVMGGAETEVGTTTRNVILECANFDMYSIRRTSMAHGLFTDAVTRFTKGQSPLQTSAVLAKIVHEIQIYAGGAAASPLIDDNHISAETLSRGSLHDPVHVTAEFIHERLGLKVSNDDVVTLLKHVEFEVNVSEDGRTLEVKAPFWRTDIVIPEDIVEEVGRLTGYDRLPMELPKRNVKPAHQNDLLELKAAVRNALSSAGANEALTYTFVHGSLLQNAGQDVSKAYQLANALSPELQYYRLSLTPSLLEKIFPNVKTGYDFFAMFELGKLHNLDNGVDEEGLPPETEALSLVIAQTDKYIKKDTGAAYYQARKYLDFLATRLGLSLRYSQLQKNNDNQMQAPYETSRSARVSIENGPELGVIGEFTGLTRSALKLPTFSAGFEIALEPLLKHRSTTNRYIALPRFPKVVQDICLRIAVDVRYQDLFEHVVRTIEEAKPQRTVARVEPVDVYQREGDQTHKQLTFRLTIASYEKTMTDAEVTSLLDKVTQASQQRFAAERV